MVGQAVLVFIVSLREDETETGTTDDLLDERVRQRTAELCERATALEKEAARLRKVACDLGEAESRERQRLARKLHDHFQQLISAAKMKLGILRRRTTDPATAEVLSQAEHLLKMAMGATRSLGAELAPPNLGDGGLAEALDWLARRMERNHGLSVRLTLQGFKEPQREETRTVVFECVQELLFNIVKHADVKGADVMAAAGPMGQLMVCVTDAGKGFDVATARSASSEGLFGLVGLHDRLNQVGGSAKITSSAGKGTRVEMRVPMGE
jgi:signal transduction histidine kinase